MRDATAKEYRKEHRRLHETKEKILAAGLGAKGLMVQGVTAEKLAEQANKLDVGLMIVGSHQHGAVLSPIRGEHPMSRPGGPGSTAIEITFPRKQTCLAGSPYRFNPRRPTP